MIGGTKHVLKEQRRHRNSSNSSTPSATTCNLSDINTSAQLVAAAESTNTSVPPLTQNSLGAPSAEWPLQSGHAQSIFNASAANVGNSMDNHQNGVPGQQVSNNFPPGVPADWGFPSAFYSNPSQIFESGMQEPTQVPSSSRHELPAVTSSTDRLREYAHLGPAGFPMNVDISSNDFDVRGISGMAYFADAVTNSRTSTDNDAIIEDAWRNILEDARLSTSGLNDQLYY